MIIFSISKGELQGRYPWAASEEICPAQVVQLELRCDIFAPLQGVTSGLISNARGTVQDPAVFTFLAICVVQAAESIKQ